MTFKTVVEVNAAAFDFLKTADRDNLKIAEEAQNLLNDRDQETEQIHQMMAERDIETADILPGGFNLESSFWKLYSIGCIFALAWASTLNVCIPIANM